LTRISTLRHVFCLIVDVWDGSPLLRRSLLSLFPET
ncbi:hypothetical protein M2277_002750, partial [Paenibacillus sp. LBL]|nr:hypothetical protein [Paenibacillus sp. LBL]